MTVPQTRLFGREQLLDQVFADIHRKRTMFGLEGPTGVGKSALLEEVSEHYKSYGFDAIAKVNAAQEMREDLAIAAIYRQLNGLVRDPKTLAEKVRERFSKDELPGALTKIGSAVIADLLTLATHKAENTVDAIREIMAGEEPAPSVTSQLETLEKDNRRFFLNHFLAALVDAGNFVGVAIDNFESADTSLVDLVRTLISHRPDGIALVLAHNTEVGRNTDWDYVTADLQARGGVVLPVEPLQAPAIEIWFQSEVGRRPAEAELHELLRSTGGRASDVKRWLEAIKNGEPPPLASDYTGYYGQTRRKLSAAAHHVADLLAVINRDAMVPEDLLAAASHELGVDNLGPALDELTDHRLLKREGRLVALPHSDVRQFWLNNINARRNDDLRLAWFATVRGYSVEQITGGSANALLPVIAEPLLQERPADFSRIGTRLIELGQTTAGLSLIDQLWQFEPTRETKAMEMHRHALLAASTRLDLGRYREVDEPLRMAELAAGDNVAAKLQALLLRMKLALRRNNYLALWEIASQLEQDAKNDIGVCLESELLQNVALRDLMSLDELSASTRRLQELHAAVEVKEQNGIERALARSFAKLGDNEAALTYARNALKSASRLGSIRAVGNSHLAMGEVCRYRHEHVDALAAYDRAEDIARSSGNRDSLLWSLLGKTAAYFEAGDSGRALKPLRDVQALVAEPGYDHPIEAAHAQLLRVLLSKDASAHEDLLATYASLNIDWPREFLQKLAASQDARLPTPL